MKVRRMQAKKHHIHQNHAGNHIRPKPSVADFLQMAEPAGNHPLRYQNWNPMAPGKQKGHHNHYDTKRCIYQ